jgi:hypothetical protein
MSFPVANVEEFGPGVVFQDKNAGIGEIVNGRNVPQIVTVGSAD